MIGSIVMAALVWGGCWAFYRVKYGRSAGLAEYLGVKRAPAVTSLYALAVAAAMTGASLSVFAFLGLQELVLNPHTLASVLKAEGVSLHLLGRVLAFGFVGTALWEEILFRGFLSKRLMNVFGAVRGNLAHAAVFGGIHVLLYRALGLDFGIPAYLLIFCVPALTAYISVLLNERPGGGSILPGYLVHALMNVMTPFGAAFLF